MNSVLDMAEAMRAESIAPYGHPLVRTPHFSRLAEEGVRLELLRPEPDLRPVALLDDDRLVSPPYEPTNIYDQMRSVLKEHPESRQPAVMMRTHDHKLIYRRAAGCGCDQCELYDMRSDPLELHNLYDGPARASLREALERQLLSWYMNTNSVTSWERDPRATPWLGGI